ncbi:hypothetical protein Tco_1403977 [Tanacetum coccineum]
MELVDIVKSRVEYSGSGVGTKRCTDKLKNHKKAVKNEQARTQESEEYKAEARKVKPQSKSAKKNQTLSHSKATSSMEEAQVYMVFCAKSLREEAQVSLTWIASLAIRVRSLSDPTAQNLAPMID